MQNLFASIFLILVFSFAIFAQSERDAGIESYRTENYGNAISILKKATKNNSTDGQAWYYLGLSYLKKDDAKNAIKALKQATDIEPNDARIHSALAYAYLLKNSLSEANAQARASLALDSKNEDALYVLGSISFRNGSYSSAYDSAVKIIEMFPNHAPAYSLKAESLISSFIQQIGTVTKSNTRGALLTEAAESLEKYLSLAKPNEQTQFYQNYLDSVKFFAEYYSRSENQPPKSGETPVSNITPIIIKNKPRAPYTDAARSAGLSGVVKLAVEFSAGGTVKHILILKPLAYGLSEAAVRAARNIKFTPAVKDGKPISVVKVVEYSFTLY